MTEPVYIPQLVGQGLARLTSAYVTQPNVRALLAVYLRPFQEIEDALWNVYLGRMLANATLYKIPEMNSVLDVLGAIVGVERQALSDAQYAILIRVCALCNRSSGTMQDWSTIVGILASTDAFSGPIQWESGTRSFGLGLWDLSLPPQVLCAVLSRARPTGIRGLLEYSSWVDGSDFDFSSVSDSASGELGWSSVSDAAVGGLMVACFDMPPSPGAPGVGS